MAASGQPGRAPALAAPGSRTISATAERRAQRGVAVSFWLQAPHIAAEPARDLAAGHRAGVTVTGMALTAAWPGGWWLDPVAALMVQYSKPSADSPAANKGVGGPPRTKEGTRGATESAAPGHRGRRGSGAGG